MHIKVNDISEDGKTKTWKGKLKSFRKLSSSPSQVSCGVSNTEGAMFGVPLEDCLPSPHNEVMTRFFFARMRFSR